MCQETNKIFFSVSHWMDGALEGEDINVAVNRSIGCQILYDNPSLAKFLREQATNNITMDSIALKLDVRIKIFKVSTFN